MKVRLKNILKKGLEVLLALHLSALPNLAEKNKDISYYFLTLKQMQAEYDTTIDVDCRVSSKKAGVIKIKEGDIAVVMEEYSCEKPHKINANDRYITKIVDYLIIVDGIEGREISVYKPICFEEKPYIRQIMLNTGRVLYYLDKDRNGKPDEALYGNFPKDEIPIPKTDKSECPKSGNLI